MPARVPTRARWSETARSSPPARMARPARRLYVSEQPDGGYPLPGLRRHDREDGLPGRGMLPVPELPGMSVDEVPK